MACSLRGLFGVTKVRARMFSIQCQGRGRPHISRTRLKTGNSVVVLSRIGTDSNRPPSGGSLSDPQRGADKLDGAKTPNSSIPFPSKGDQSVKKEKVYLERNFITTIRAVNDFLLSPKHLEGLRMTTRRSAHLPYKGTTVYWRKDVEKRAIAVWGSIDAIKAEKERKEGEQQKRTVAHFLQKLFNEEEKRTKISRSSWPVRGVRANNERGLDSDSGKVIMAAIGINAANLLLKTVAWLMTGSHAMFSEVVHSAADTGNQAILAYGLKSSAKQADHVHPYGYTNMQNVSSLISGVGIFFMGAGLSIYHGINGLVQPHGLESLHLALGILGVSFLSESATLALAIKSIRESANAAELTFFDFVLRGYDPCVNVVLLEDTAAVLGVVIAAASMSLSVYTGSHIPDAVGSIAIGVLLGGVATFMISSNTTALVGKSIPQDKIEQINARLEGDRMVRAIHDVKGIDMGNGIIRYKAEVDVDGKELAIHYLTKMTKAEKDALMCEIKSVESNEQMEEFVQKHGEKIVELLGEQVDRIEKELQKHHPEVRHVDLEVL